jgi:quinone-modifying oxidoreductase subunit QmoC
MCDFSDTMAAGAAVTERSNANPVRIEPDLIFIQELNERSGSYFMKCMQCGTCSATCTLSPDSGPFPSKEMAWANWGMRDRLMHDPDVWLCHQCHDCSTRCPRSARPGELLAALRQENIIQYSFPRFVGRWVSRPAFIPLLLAVPIILLTLALALKVPIENWLDLSRSVGEEIIYSYSAIFPRWLLNGFFFIVSGFVGIVVLIGIFRFLSAIKGSYSDNGNIAPKNSLASSIFMTIKDILGHENFAKCTTAKPRFWSHLLVFFGFLFLSAVTVWVFTSGLNPLINSNFVYPFGFWDPWKLLANIGGLAVTIGCSLMIRDRFKNEVLVGSGGYFDWIFLSLLLMVVLSGFATEILHYVRLEPHRHLIYFVHLVFAGSLILYLPYSKFIHMIYRTIALIYARKYGRELGKAVDKAESEANGTVVTSGETGQVAAGDV